MDDITPWKIADAELEVDPSGEEPFIVPSSGSEHGIETANISARIQDTIDEATFQIANVGAEYQGEKRLTRGDRLTWRVRLEGESEFTERWSGMLIEPEYERVFDAPDEDFYLGWIELDAEDYVFRTLADRTIHRVFDEEDIGGIIETLIGLKASDLDTDLDETNETATIVANGLNLLEVIEYLANLADAILIADGTTLVLRVVDDLTPEFTVEREDIAMGFSVRENADNLANTVRIDGGTAAQLDDSQQDTDGWYNVTDSDRLTTRLSATRSRLDRIEVYTRPIAGSDDELRVRLQRDDGSGSPKNPESPTADIDRVDLSPDDGRFQDDGWTAFFLGDHRLHDQDPWLIVDSNREDGHEVAVNSNNNVAFRAYYQYPIISEDTDPESAENYGRVERVITDDSIRTTPAARERVESEITHNNEPLREVEFEATSVRMRNLSPGEVVTLGSLFEPENATGDWIVAQVNDSYDEGHLRTNIVLRHLDSL